MPSIEIPGQHVFFVRWSCRKCGHAGGVAKTTIPLPESALTEPVLRNLFQVLREKLSRSHLKQHCFASTEDFRIERGTPQDAEIVGLK